jgi:hypothetical protein
MSDYATLIQPTKPTPISPPCHCEARSDVAIQAAVQFPGGLFEMRAKKMLKTMLRLLACATVLIIVAACDTQFSAMPNPVVVKDGVYWFPLGGRLFAVPEKYVTRYGRNSTDGSLHAFSLHALLPNFEGRASENKAEFNKLGWGKRIEITVALKGGSKTREEVERNAYQHYLRNKKMYGSDVISKKPHVERIVGYSNPFTYRNSFYLIENERVKKEIHCDKARPMEKYKTNPNCKNIDLYYQDNICAWIVYSQSYEQDWIKIHDQIIAFLESFERPLDAFPTQP